MSFRVTIRRLMRATVVLAVVCWLVVEGIRVRDDHDTVYLAHCHMTGDLESQVNRIHPAPFWPRYWRRLLGRPWPGSYACPCEFGSLSGWATQACAANCALGSAVTPR